MKVIKYYFHLVLKPFPSLPGDTKDTKFLCILLERFDNLISVHTHTHTHSSFPSQASPFTQIALLFVQQLPPITDAPGRVPECCGCIGGQRKDDTKLMSL